MSLTLAVREYRSARPCQLRAGVKGREIVPRVKRLLPPVVAQQQQEDDPQHYGRPEQDTSTSKHRQKFQRSTA